MTADRSETDDPLFRNRKPEEAARQVAMVLATSAEMHLATLEMLEGRKSASASDLRRQKEICRVLVDQCADLGISTRGLRGESCQRLEERLADRRRSGHAR